MVAYCLAVFIPDPLSPVVALHSVCRGIFSIGLATDREEEGLKVMGTDLLGVS